MNRLSSLEEVIAFVDDDALMRSAYETLIEPVFRKRNIPYEVKTFQDVDGLREFIRLDLARVICLVTDLGGVGWGSGVDGILAFKDVEKFTGPTLVATGQGAYIGELSDMEAVGVYLLAKPFSMVGLIDRLESILVETGHLPNSGTRAQTLV